MLVTSTAESQCIVWNLANSSFPCTFSLFATCSESGLSPRQPYLFPHPVWELETSREASCQPKVVNKRIERIFSLTFPLITCACDVPVNHWVSLGHAQLQAISSPWKAGTGYTCFCCGFCSFWRTLCSFLGCPLRMCLPHSLPWSGVHAVRYPGSTLDCQFRGQQILQPGFALLLFLQCLIHHGLCGGVQEENVSTAALLPFPSPLSCDKFTLACTPK